MENLQAMSPEELAAAHQAAETDEERQAIAAEVARRIAEIKPVVEALLKEIENRWMAYIMAFLALGDMPMIPEEEEE